MSHDHCGTSGCNAHHHHHHSKNECCKSGCKCHCHSHHDKECHLSDDLLQMADDAWMELLSEKIKERILAKSGAQLDKLAELVADANGERWKNKMGSHKQCEDFKSKVAEFFCQCNK